MIASYFLLADESLEKNTKMAGKSNLAPPFFVYDELKAALL